MFTNKLQERRRLSPPRRQGSSSPPHYKNVGIYDPKTSRFLFTYKLQERRHLRSQDSKLPVHLRITRTSLLDTATIVSSCSRVVSACACFAWGRSIALCQKKKMFWADLCVYSHEIYISHFASIIAQQCFFIAYFAWGRAIIYLIIYCRRHSQKGKKLDIFFFSSFGANSYDA